MDYGWMHRLIRSRFPSFRSHSILCSSSADNSSVCAYTGRICI
jgi:hypothetical protein